MDDEELKNEDAVAKMPLELTGSRKRLKERYPDENPEDDPGWENLHNRYMDETEAELSNYKGAEEKMSELCRVYPEFAELVYNMLENKLPLRAAVARVFSQEDLIPQEGDEDYEAYQKAYNERLEGNKKKDAQTKEIEANEAKSMEAIDAFCREKGLSDEQKDELIGVINDHFTELLYKRISPEMLEGFLKQMSFDSAVADAEKVGVIKGRNENIEAKRVKEKKETVGDGLPGGSGGGSLKLDSKPKAKGFFGDMKERVSI